LKSIHTSNPKEKKAQVATTAPVALIQLLKSERCCGGRFGSGVVGVGVSDMVKEGSEVGKKQKKRRGH
jgi:hypothetical protein